MKKYTAKFFLRFLENIPRNQWTVGTLNEGNKHCVLGHCGVKDDGDMGSLYIYSAMGLELKKLFEKYVGLNPLDVNDYEGHLTHKNPQFMTTSGGLKVTGRHPKTRIVRAVKFIIRKQNAANR
jgi:hypothetical protein